MYILLYTVMYILSYSVIYCYTVRLLPNRGEQLLLSVLPRCSSSSATQWSYPMIRTLLPFLNTSELFLTDPLYLVGKSHQQCTFLIPCSQTAHAQCEPLPSRGCRQPPREAQPAPRASSTCEQHVHSSSYTSTSPPHRGCTQCLVQCYLWRLHYQVSWGFQKFIHKLRSCCERWSEFLGVSKMPLIAYARQPQLQRCLAVCMVLFSLC